MKIYITGATGRLGREVLRKIPNAIPLVLEKSGLRNEMVSGFGADELCRILRDADVIIHLAGSMNFLNEKKMWETNVGLSKRIADAAPQNARIVFASSISVYGKKLVEIPADEETEVRPDTLYAKSKLEAEKIILAKNKNSVILRIGTIYGPQFEDYYKILKMIAEGRMKIIGDGNNRISFVHVEDVAEAIKNSINARAGTYVITGESLPQKEIYAVAAKALGVEPPKKHVPVSIALFFAWVEETKARLFGKKPKITREHMLVLSSNRVFDCSKAKKELKFKPRRLSEGIKELARGVVRRG